MNLHAAWRSLWIKDWSPTQCAAAIASIAVITWGGHKGDHAALTPSDGDHWLHILLHFAWPLLAGGMWVAFRSAMISIVGARYKTPRREFCVASTIFASTALVASRVIRRWIVS